MKNRKSKILTALLAAACLGPLPALLSTVVHGQGANEQVAALKTTLARSQANLKNYQWLETTVIRMKGEEKSRTTNLCAYGADGNVQKTPQGPPPPDKKEKRGLRGKVVENKTAEITEYMQSVLDLIAVYVPPDGARIQAAMGAGKISVTPIVPNARVRLDVRDYLKAGDLLQIELDLVSHQLLKVNVSSYLEAPSDAVTLAVGFNSLADGTGHVAEIDLNGTSEKIQVLVSNGDYHLK